MALHPAHRRRLDPALPGLLALTLGTALIVSTLAQPTGAPNPASPLVNRTAEAIAGFEDMTPPEAGQP